MKNGVVVDAAVPEGAQRKLLGENAVEVYRLD